MTASVVLVTYRRLERLPEILKAWCDQCADVWLCDCSKDGAQNIPGQVKVARFCPDPGNRTRHAVATMTLGDICIKADDDIMPLPGLVDDFLTWHQKLGPCISGVHGRTFHGPDYYHDSNMFAGHMQTEPVPVDFVGVLTCSDRVFLPMDLRYCGTDIEDLYWHSYCYPYAPKYVIPTKNYNNKLPESRDAGRLCADKEGKARRREFYRQCWEKFYQGRTR
jgi:hypothetical protein